MPIIGWIRDLFGIQKDMYETKKTRLEIEKIEDEKREKIIFPASFEDVKKYDPNYRALERRAKDEEESLKLDPRPCGESLSNPTPIWLRMVRELFWLIIIFGLVALLIFLFYWSRGVAR